MFSNTSDSQASSFNPFRILWGIFFIALVFRLWGVTNPLLDFHGWRQTLTATIAYNFYVEGMNVFNPSPNRQQIHAKRKLRAQISALLKPARNPARFCREI